MCAGEGGMIVWGVIAPIVWPLSGVMSSVPGERTIIVNVDTEKSGWARNDCTMNFVI